MFDWLWIEGMPWDQPWRAVYVISQLILAFCFTAIPAVLYVGTTRKTREEASDDVVGPVYVMWTWVVWLTVCGVGYLLDAAFALWHPNYHFYAIWHALMALASVNALIVSIRHRVAQLVAEGATWKS